MVSARDNYLYNFSAKYFAALLVSNFYSPWMSSSAPTIHPPQKTQLLWSSASPAFIFPGAGCLMLTLCSTLHSLTCSSLFSLVQSLSVILYLDQPFILSSCWTLCLFIFSLTSAKLLKSFSPPWILFKTLDGADHRNISNSSPPIWFSPPELPTLWLLIPFKILSQIEGKREYRLI